MKANFKTNAMRILESEGIPFTAHHYESKDGKIDGISVAEKMGQPVETVYKTLVTMSPQKEYYVFVIPVAEELDLKAAARAVGAKSVEMIKVADINKVTGYIRGGCSPVGMKKQYTTVIDSSCLLLERFYVSAGKIGYQLEIAPRDLIRAVGAETAEIIHKA
jgi:Cys-tRNA(Pro)/Cys-tRNA(Cys) deacylase